jgi:very-short-patch-repair endonuclease
MIRLRRSYRGLGRGTQKWKRKLAKKFAKNQSGPEKVLWNQLCSKQLGVWFYKQRVMLGYILDFWCPVAGLAVEVDGPHHLKRRRRERDRQRDNRLARKGVEMVRFSADMVRKSPKGVAAAIRACVEKRMGRR